MEEKKQSNRLLPVVIIGILLLAAVIVLLVVLLVRKPADAGTVSIDDGAVPRIGYADNVVVASNENDLQAAVDAMYAQTGSAIGLSYKNNAFSTNGIDFECYIANSTANAYDMYIDIYTDPEMTDEIYLSQLLRPGTAFEHITLDRALEPGEHQVFVAFTQVEEVDGVQGIHGQAVVTMDLNVSG